MPTEKLGRRLLASLAPVIKPTTIYDSDLKGFGLRLMPPSARNPAGSRSWVVEYRPGAGGRSVAKKRVVLGSVNTLTPESARDAAKTMLASVRLGADPSANRSELRTAKAIAELAPLYDEETNPVRRATTVALYNGYWSKYVLPALGSSVARSVTRSDVVRLHRSIGRKHQIAANRVVTLLAHFFEWAQESGYVPSGHNPAKGVPRFEENGRERYLTPGELTRLGAALHLAETEGVEWLPSDMTKPTSKHTSKRPEVRRTKIDNRAADAIRLLLFTGARLREVLHLKWDYVDLERGLLFLPTSKTGRKTVVLGTPALAILERMHAESLQASKAADAGARPISPFVFYSADNFERPKADLKRPWRLVTREAGLTGVRIHDLRHSFASVGAGSGLGLPIIGKLLGHSSPSTTARYSHLDADPLRRATDMISGTIAASLIGKDGPSDRYTRAEDYGIQT